MNTLSKKITSFEVLKVLAMGAVICLHTFAYPDDENKVWIYYAVRSVCRFAVPFFFLVSGYFFGRTLLREGRVMPLYFKYALRWGSIYFLWVFIYLCVSHLGIRTLRQDGLGSMGLHALTEALGTLKDWLFSHPFLLFFQGSAGSYYHLWFLPALLSGLGCLALFIHLRRERWLLPVCGALFFVGLLSLAYVRTPLGIEWTFPVRNGPFFSAIFVYLGYRQALSAKAPSFNSAAILMGTGLMFQLSEHFFLEKYFSTPDFDFALGTLPFALGFFRMALARPNFGEGTFFARWGTLTSGIYLSHMLFADKLAPWTMGWLESLPSSLWLIREFARIPVIYALSAVLVFIFRKTLLKKKQVAA